MENKTGIELVKSMLIGRKYRIRLSSGWIGDVYYRGYSDARFCFFFSKKPLGRKANMPIDNLVETILLDEATNDRD